MAARQVTRQVRRSVVMSNLRVGLLAMDSDRLPLRKRKDVLHGAARAAPSDRALNSPVHTVARIAAISESGERYVKQKQAGKGTAAKAKKLASGISERQKVVADTWENFQGLKTAAAITRHVERKLGKSVSSKTIERDLAAL